MFFLLKIDKIRLEIVILKFKSLWKFIYTLYYFSFKKSLFNIHTTLIIFISLIILQFTTESAIDKLHESEWKRNYKIIYT